MTYKIKMYAWDIAEHLRTEEESAAYMTAVLAEGAPTVLLSAVGDIAKARGLAEIAQNANISRSTLYHSFSKRPHIPATSFKEI